MYRFKISDAGVALATGALLTMLAGLLTSGCSSDQGQQPQAPHSRAVETWTQNGYLGSPECLTEGIELAWECNDREQLPWCVSGAGSGPGVWCFWPDARGGLRFHDGDPGNDPRVVR